MEIINTIPQYTAPLWVFIVICCGLVIALLAACLKDTEYMCPILGCIAFIVVITGLVAYGLTHNSVYVGDEYIVKITDMSAREFNDKYIITKRFEYSDVIQIKERNK